MGTEQLINPFRLLDIVDEDTRVSIIRLNQKLVDLQAEVVAKLTGFETPHEDEMQRSEFLNFQKEIQKAQDSIDTLVNQVISEPL
ncbi:hypothetical protein [Legionella nagasakiensis]|uniref:hypothetical protein n=1 Tax=Legionella nagasakiensis TaxID=535290 RepID=UPI001054854E|nr:hypothetical protein [Legionella nagasakiensis]